MKFFSLNSFWALCCLSIFASCTEDDFAGSPENEYVLPSCQTYSFNIGFKGIEEGCFHNSVAKVIVDSWSICPEGNENLVVHELQRILETHSSELLEEEGISQEGVDTVLSYLDPQDIVNSVLDNDDYWIESMNALQVSDTLKNLLLGFHTVISNIQDGEWNAVVESESVSFINTKFYEYYEANKSLLSENEKQLFGMYVDVAAGSNYLWSPIEFGGLGYFDVFQTKLQGFCGQSHSRGWFKDWYESSAFGKFIGADAIGAVAGAVKAVVLSGGAAALPNPLLGGLPTASAVALFDGATASVLSQL